MSEQLDEKVAVTEPPTSQSGQSAKPPAGITSGRNLAQILMALVVLLVLVNIPINYKGLGLAHIIPDSEDVVIYDGIVLKGSGPDIYVLKDHKLRQISSPEARHSYFYSDKIRTVENDLLEQFAQGPPIRRLVKCSQNSLVYALENGQKRWVRNPPPEDQSNPWDTVQPISCGYLNSLPDGLPIPEDAGSPPQP